MSVDYFGLTRDHTWLSINEEQYNKLKPDYRMVCYSKPKPLSDEEIKELSELTSDPDPTDFVRAIEERHGIK